MAGGTGFGGVRGEESCHCLGTGMLRAVWGGLAVAHWLRPQAVDGSVCLSVVATG